MAYRPYIKSDFTMFNPILMNFLKNHGVRLRFLSNLLIFETIYRYHQRYRIFFSAEKLVGHTFIQISESCFFSHAAEKKYKRFLDIFGDFSCFFFFGPAKFIGHSFIQMKQLFFFFPVSEKKKTAFSFIQSVLPKNV